MSRYGGQRRDLILEPVSGPISASLEGASIVCHPEGTFFEKVSSRNAPQPTPMQLSILEQWLWLSERCSFKVDTKSGGLT